MSQRFAIVNARLVDPASGMDEAGGVLVEDHHIVEFGPGVRGINLDDVEVIDAHGAILAPALIDLRAGIEPPFTPGGETISSLSAAAAAGGIGTLVLGPHAATPFDTPETVRALGHETRPMRVRMPVAGGATRSLAGETMSEIGLMHDAGALFVSNGDAPIADTRVLRSLLSYASHFEAWVAVRPADACLSAGAAATEGEWAARNGIPAEPTVAERMAIERLAALGELTGGRVLIDRISTEEGLEALSRAKRKGLEIGATASVNSLLLNEVDAGGYDASMRLVPPLRFEADREALVRAITEGLVDAIVSDHRPLSVEAKSEPWPEAAAGSTGVETLLSGLLSLVHGGQLELIDAMRVVTSGPADLIGLPQGRMEEGAPADLVLIDGDAPWVYRAADGLSARRNAALEGRRFQGRVLKTFVAGAMIHTNDN